MLLDPGEFAFLKLVQRSIGKKSMFQQTTYVWIFLSKTFLGGKAALQHHGQHLVYILGMALNSEDKSLCRP